MGAYTAFTAIIAGIGFICLGSYFLWIEASKVAIVSKDVEDKFKDL
jgi:hypothetical protein